MAIREIQLEGALRVNPLLRVWAECLIAAYVEPRLDRPAIMNELIAQSDGPAQREAQTPAAAALGKTR